ncbi:MAG: exo-alpha-sialidase [Deltaproteobacteria bacterium]|nr:exo-alpha-sialidase [Deltaproteobacteria bacterium]
MNRRLVITLCLITLGLYAWPAYEWVSSGNRDRGTFTAAPVSSSSPSAAPFMIREFISPDSGTGMVHVGSICELPRGGLAAAWYGGTREGARDVAVFLSLKGPEDASWSRPKTIMDRASASRDLSRYVKKVGNPLLFSGPGERLWLIYVTIAVGGWSGSSLNVTWSDDNGATWTRSRRLTLSPFFNISELVRNRPLSMSNGGFAVPIYHEFLGYFPEMLWLQPPLKGPEIHFTKSRMTGGQRFIQPSVVALGPFAARAFYRSRAHEKAIGTAATEDAGASWSEPRPLSLPNPDSGLDALLLSDQRILLAFNDSTVNRENLRLAVSDDQGRRWTRIATLDSAPKGEFSYPYMIRTQDGRIHLVYTWNRKRIRHIVLNAAWIDARMKGTLK